MRKHEASAAAINVMKYTSFWKPLTFANCCVNGTASRNAKSTCTPGRATRSSLSSSMSSRLTRSCLDSRSSSATSDTSGGDLPSEPPSQPGDETGQPDLPRLRRDNATSTGRYFALRQSLVRLDDRVE